MFLERFCIIIVCYFYNYILNVGFRSIGLQTPYPKLEIEGLDGKQGSGWYWDEWRYVHTTLHDAKATTNQYLLMHQEQLTA